MLTIYNVLLRFFTIKWLSFEFKKKKKHKMQVTGILWFWHENIKNILMDYFKFIFINESFTFRLQFRRSKWSYHYHNIFLFLMIFSK